MTGFGYEIDFLAVGSNSRSGDAIAVRYGEPDDRRIIVYDGGDTAAGEAMVKHIRTHYGSVPYVNAIVCSHIDDDHTSGLREIIKALPVGAVYINRPWLYAAELLPAFHDQRMTVESLQRRLCESYPIVAEIEALALERGIPVYEAFQGNVVGPFTILAPSRARYINLVPDFSRTPDAAKSESAFADFGSFLLEKAVEVIRGVAESWGVETLAEDGETSPVNESSVVMAARFVDQVAVLTGDAGLQALDEAYRFGLMLGLLDRPPKFIQVPHHGSRRNVSPSMLDRWLGPKLGEEGSRGIWAYVSAAKEDEKHPRKVVTNAFRRRGASVYATKGQNIWYYRNMPERKGYGPITPLPLYDEVEE